MTKVESEVEPERVVGIEKRKEADWYYEVGAEGSVRDGWGPLNAFGNY